MNTITIVFALIGACTAGLGAYIVSMVSLREKCGWANILGFMTCVVVLFCGPVVAADGTFWSFIIGGVLVLTALVILWGYFAYKRPQQLPIEETIELMHPEGKWDETIAIRDYRGIDSSIVGELSIEYMKQVFESRLVECQQLGLVDFKRECLRNISVNAVDGFAEKVGLLFFAEPSQAADCRQWFNECATLLRECSRAQGKELLIAIQYIWSHDVFSPGLRQDFTLLALGRIEPELGWGLCKAIIAAHSQDPWVKAHLPKPPESPKKDDATPSSDSKEPTASETPETSRGSEAIKTHAPKPPCADNSPPDPMERWYPMGDYAECRLCSFRPPKRWNIARGAQRTMWRLDPWGRKCKTCKCHTVDLGLIQNPEPVIPAPGPQ